jgi:uracil phosphoribosyltransferase
LEYLETILKTFPIDIDSTTRRPLSNTKPSTRLYTVDTERSPLISSIHGKCYLIDTPQGREIAYHPHIVSQELSHLCLDAAEEFAVALKELDLVSDRSGILHILRGSSGYMIDKALPGLPVINIRTQYSTDGYRAHSDDSRRIDVTYSDYCVAMYDTLIVPDTYATGRSVEAALQYLFERGLSVKNIVLYGFIAVPGIESVYQLLSKYDVKLHIFAICDITQLYSNHYDMPLYGLDEHLYNQNKTIKPLGSIVSLDTLRDMIHQYVPGMDQPGDWSERHNNLFNGHTYESGDIKGHLVKSLQFIESLDKMNTAQPWYDEHIRELTQRELIQLRSTLNSL